MKTESLFPFKAFGLIFCSVSLAFFCACNGPSRVSNATAVEVNEHVLTAKDLAARLARRIKSLDALAAKDPNNVTRAKEKIIRDFVVQSIIEDFAKVNNLTVTESALDAEVASARANYPDDLSFRRVLAQEDLSLSDWRAELRESLLTNLVFKKVSERLREPNAQDVQHYYDDNKDRYRRKERIFLRQIVLDDLTKAEAVHAELIKSKDFVSFAKKYSVAPEAKEGGAVGWIERGSVDIFDKAFQLGVGNVSQVLESSYGFHIFKVDRKAPAGVASIDEVRKEIVGALLAQREQVEFIGWLDKRLRQTRVMRNSDLISAITAETKGKR